MSRLFGRFKKKSDEGKETVGEPKPEKHAAGSRVDLPRPRTNLEQGSELSGGSLFSGMKISSSTLSESPTATRTAISHQNVDVQLAVETVAGGETGFSFISQLRDEPDVQEFGVASPLEKFEKESDLRDYAALESEPAVTAPIIEETFVSEAAELDVSVKDDGDLGGDSSPGGSSHKRKKKLRAKRPGQQRDAFQQAEMRLEEESTVEPLVNIDDGDKKELADLSLQDKDNDVEKESYSSVKDDQPASDSYALPTTPIVGTKQDHIQPVADISAATSEAKKISDVLSPSSSIDAGHTGPIEAKQFQTVLSDLSDHVTDGGTESHMTDSESRHPVIVDVLNDEVSEEAGHVMVGMDSQVSGQGLGQVSDEDPREGAVIGGDSLGSKSVELSRNSGHGEAQASRYDIELSVSERLAVVVQSAEAQLEEIRQQWLGLSEEQRDKMTRQSERHQLKLEKRQQIHDLRSQQATAVSEENYEKADELNSQMDNLNTELTELSTETSEHMAEVHSRLNVISEREVEVREGLIQRLTEVKEDEAGELAEFKQTSAALIARERQRLNVDRDRMQRQQSHIRLDREHYEKGEALLAKEVDEKTAEFTAAKKRLLGLRDGLRAEIGELEARLVLLRSHEAEYSSSIAAEDEKIATIKQEMTLERERLDDQKAQIDVKQLALDTELEELTDSQHTFDMMVEENKEKESRYVSEMQSIVCHIEDCESRIDQVKRQRRHVERLVLQEKLVVEEDEELKRLHVAENDSHERLQSITAKVLEQQVHASKLRKQLKDIEESLPAIQESKKLAASGRNFKEASRLAKEAAALSDQQQTVTSELSQLVEQLSDSEKTLDSMRIEHDSLKQEVDSRQKDFDIRLMQDAVNRAASLQHHMSNFSAEKDAFLCLLFQSEISHCQAVAQELGVKHELPIPKASDLFDLDVGTEECKGVAVKRVCDDDVTGSEDELHILQERTPGVGEEFDVAAAQGRARDAGKPESETTSEESRAVQDRIAELEKQVEEAAGKEDYDTAALLDEEIQKLKSTL